MHLPFQKQKLFDSFNALFRSWDQYNRGLRSFAGAILTRVGVSTAAVLDAVIVAWLLGKEGLGLFGLLMAMPAILVLLTELGVSISIPYLVNNRKRDVQRVLGNSLFAGLLVGFLDFFIWMALAPLIQARFLRSLPLSWVMAAGISPLVLILNLDLASTFRALQRYALANVMIILPELVILLSILFMLLLHTLSATVLLPCIIFSQLTTLAFGLFQVGRLGFKPWPIFNRALLSESVSFGIRGQMGNAINLLNYRLDHLILAALTDLGTVGVYVVATKAAEFFKLIPTAVAFILEPKIARKNPREASRLALRLMAPTFLLNLTMIILGYFIGPRLIPLIFSEWSRASLLPFNILLIGWALRGFVGVLSAFNLGQGYPEINTYSVTLGLVVTITLDILLIPRLSVIGAAIASSAAYASSAALVLLFFFLLNKQHLKQLPTPEVKAMTADEA